MTETNSIRRKRLSELVSEHEDQESLADVIGYTPSYISQLITGHRNVGEKTARKIEKKTGKPSGWLDQAGDVRSEIVDIIQEISGRDETEQRRILGMLRAYMSE